jgi:hypothetical protein
MIWLADADGKGKRPELRVEGQLALFGEEQDLDKEHHDSQWYVEEGGGIDVEAALGADDVGGQVSDAVVSVPSRGTPESRRFPRLWGCRGEPAR